MSHHTTMREALHDLLLSPGTDVADAMDRHFDPAYSHSINGTWSTRAQYPAQVAQVRATLSDGTIEVHQELRQGTSNAERHTLELAMTDGRPAGAVKTILPPGRGGRARMPVGGTDPVTDHGQPSPAPASSRKPG